MVEVLRVEEKMNLFAIFPIGTTMQDGGKRKRSMITFCLLCLCLNKEKEIQNKIKKPKREEK